MRPDRFEDIIALVALYRPGPMANIPTYFARKHGARAAGLPPSEARADPARDLRRHHLPGAGDADRAGPGRLHARRGRPAAPRHGQEDQEGDGRAARRASSPARSSAASSAARPRRSSSCSASSPATASTRATPRAYALVAYQTAYLKANYPVEFLAASMTLDMGNTDKLAEFRAEAERLGIKVEPPSINRSGVEFDVERQHHPLRAGRAAGVGRAGGREHSSRRAASGRSPTSPISPAASIRARQQARAGKPGRRRRLRCARAEPRPRLRRPSTPCSPPRNAPTRTPRIGQIGAVRRRGGAPSRCALPAVEPWLPAERLQREYEAVGFFLSGHPLDDYAAALKRLRVQSWADFCPRGEGRRRRRPGRRHRGLAHRAAHQDRQQDGHHRPLRPQRPLRGGDVRRRPGAVPRPARAGHGGAVVPDRRGARRRGARPHPVGRAARSGGGEDAEGLARVPARRGADRRRGAAARADQAARRNGGRSRRRRGQRWC